MQIIGIDCAAQPKNVGLAYAQGGTILAVSAGLKDPAAMVMEWVDWTLPLMVAMDAPLGWPRAMASELGAHRPGEAIRTHPNELFRRETDRIVHRAIQKPLLDVGADKIARAAHGALSLLDEIRTRSGVNLPVRLDPWDAHDSGVLEVYPAGTLKAHGYPFQGYKKNTDEHRAIRARIARHLEDHVSIPNNSLLLDDDDALDATVCVLSAIDYLAGSCIEPDPEGGARFTEGWIWVKDPNRQNGKLQNRSGRSGTPIE